MIIPRTRRSFLRLSLAAAASAALRPSVAASLGEAEAGLPPVRQITHGPKFHWFGYYDKLEFDPTGRYVLSNEISFEHRSPRPDDAIKVGMVDLAEGDRWIELGESRAWCWQQGCMLQWRPGSRSEVLWNDREDDGADDGKGLREGDTSRDPESGRFVCRILDVETRRLRTVPHPVYAVSPCGKWAVSADFRRIDDMRPGYGYAGIPDPHAQDPAPSSSGIFVVDLEKGTSKLVVSLADVVAIPFEGHDVAGAKHWFNHLLVSPDGSRFEFLHRWRKGSSGFVTRMLTASKDGSDIRVIDPSGKTSHFIWKDPRHLLAWSWHRSDGDAFYLFEDREGGSVEVVGKGVMAANGHCTYLPGNEWILNDTYPQGRDRLQSVYLYHVGKDERRPLGSFRSPPDYGGEWRCDTHPRSSPDGRRVVIDSPHSGEGRQLFLIDVA